MSPRDSPVSSQLWVSEYEPQHFYEGSRGLNLDLVCVGPTLYPMSHLPSPLCSHRRHCQNKAVNAGGVWPLNLEDSGITEQETGLDDLP